MGRLTSESSCLFLHEYYKNYSTEFADSNELLRIAAPLIEIQKLNL